MKPLCMAQISLTHPGAEWDPEGMSWQKPISSKNQLYQAGRAIAKSAENWSAEAFGVVETWRLAHTLPLAMVTSTVRKNATAVSPTALATGRLKRMTSIRSKLHRGDVQDLSAMQDIAGCRAIVPTVTEIRNLCELFDKAGCKFKIRDYISKPRGTGYRGVHLIAEYSGRNRHEHDGMKVEVQLRTTLQHRWATAVETLTFLGSFGDLKSGRGDQRWLDYFETMAEIYAIGDDDGVIAGNVAVPSRLSAKLADFEIELGVHQVLMGFKAVADFALGRTGIPNIRKDMVCFLIDHGDDMIGVKPYTPETIALANSDYIEAESRGHNAVLVFAEDVRALIAGYPSYFSDISFFRRNAMTAAFGSAYEV